MTARETRSRPEKRNDRADKPSWRVEGMPEDDGDRSPLQRLPGGRSFWILALLLLALNFFITNLLLGPPARVLVPYTFFIEQVDAGNVESMYNPNGNGNNYRKQVVTID